MSALFRRLLFVCACVCARVCVRVCVCVVSFFVRPNSSVSDIEIVEVRPVLLYGTRLSDRGCWCGIVRVLTYFMLNVFNTMLFDLFPLFLYMFRLCVQYISVCLCCTTSLNIMYRNRRFIN